MKRVVLIAVLSACGRLHFDGGDGDAGGQGDSLGPDAPFVGNRVFITSSVHTLGALGGVANADAICNTRAMEAGIPGSYVAWLSSATSNARDRIGTTARGWRRMDGRPFADTLDDIGINKWAYPIIFDENGQLLTSGDIGTGSIYTGDYDNQGDCAGYASTTGSMHGGSLPNGSSAWTMGTMIACSTSSRLYCFGTTESVAVTPEPVVARRAFIQRQGYTTTGGRTGADAACQGDAAALKYPGVTFLALLATKSSSAISRFDLSGPPWARLDDVLLVESASDILTTGLLTSFNQSVDGYGVAGTGAWIGATDLTSNGTVETTCDDWSTSAITGYQASIAAYGPGAFAGYSVPCTTGSRPLWCLEP